MTTLFAYVEYVTGKVWSDRSLTIVTLVGLRNCAPGVADTVRTVSLLKAAGAPVSSVSDTCRVNAVFCTISTPGLPQVSLGLHGGAMPDVTDAWIWVGAGNAAAWAA